MATFLRRKLNQLNEVRSGKGKAEAVTFMRPEGSVTFSAKEASRYGMLMTMLDSDTDGQIGGLEGASFLRRSGLGTGESERRKDIPFLLVRNEKKDLTHPTLYYPICSIHSYVFYSDALFEIWRLASGGTSKTKLTREDFFVACKLVAVAQCKGAPSLEPVVRGLPGGEELPLADFHYNVVPDMAAIAAGSADSSQIAPSAIKVTVSDPTQYGSGLTKHTRYKVTTTTSLSHFARKEMVVWRRFSDFEWLNTRLSTKFPATIIPLFPTKRIVGNTDADFVKDRMHDLELFVDKVAHHPTLNMSLDLLIFLDATDDGIEAAKRYVEDTAAEDAESILVKGVDLVMNYAVTGSAALPLAIKPDEAFVQSCASHGATLARLAAAVKTAAYLDATGKEAAVSLSQLGIALAAFAEHEQRHSGAGAAAAAASASAASAAQKTSAALFVGGSGNTSTSTSVDAAAAAAFSSHSQAVQNAKDGSIGGMFNSNFSDPYTTTQSISASPSSTSGSGAPLSATEDLVQVCRLVGQELEAAGKRQVEQLQALNECLFDPLRTARDQEAELGEAVRRRDGAIDKLQDANATLQRKKKAVMSLKPADPNYLRKSQEATDAVNKAEAALNNRKDELEKMTDVLKLEMARVSRERRKVLASHLVEYAKLQSSYAAARGDSWSRLLPQVSIDAKSRQLSQEAVSTIAHKAEEKARKASQAAKTKQTGQAGQTIVAEGGSGGLRVGGEDAAIPSADEL